MFTRLAANSHSSIRYKMWASLAICILTAIGVGIQVALHGSQLIMAVLTGSGVFVIALIHLDWLLALYLVLSPLYFLAKLLLPPPIDSIWRDLLLGVIYIASIPSFFLSFRRTRVWLIPKDQHKIRFMVGLFTIAIVLQIFNSDSIATGVLGARTFFRCLPVFFVSLFLFSSRPKAWTMQFLFNAFLVGALINVFAGTLQFVMISVLGIASPGAWFDPIRLLPMSNGLAMNRFEMQRVIGFWGDPNDFGQLAVLALAIMLPRTIQQHDEKSHRGLYLILCAVTALSIVGTFAVFAIIPGLMVALLFFASLVGKRYRRFYVLGSIIIILSASALLLIPGSPLEELGYTPEAIGNSITYIPQSIAEGNFLGQGYGIYSDLAERFGVSTGSTGDKSTYWFYFDQLTVQIGLIGIILWLGLWAIFLIRAYRNHSQAPKGSIDFQLSSEVWLALVSIFLSSLHYGPYRVGGVDMLLYIMWAFVISSSHPVYVHHGVRKVPNFQSPIEKASNYHGEPSAKERMPVL